MTSFLKGLAPKMYSVSPLYFIWLLFIFSVRRFESRADERSGCDLMLPVCRSYPHLSISVPAFSTFMVDLGSRLSFKKMRHFLADSSALDQVFAIS